MILSNFQKQELKHIWQLVFILTAVVSVQYWLILHSEAHFSLLSLNRISTRQAHLAPFALPFALYPFFMSGWRRKVSAIIFSKEVDG